MMPHRSKTFAILGLLAAAGCAPAGSSAPAGAAPADGVRNVIFMVADGAGIGHWTAAEQATDAPLTVASMPVLGLVDTRSADSRVTDSAAGASVYATGVRVDNRTISVEPGCRALLRRDSMALKRDPSGCPPLESVFEIARRQGMSTGVVTTTSVVDATPAAFAAHSPSRYWDDYLAGQFAEAGLAVILGGGRESFDAASRDDHVDLLGRMCADAACVRSASELAAYRADDRPLVGLFAPADMGKAGVRSPALPQMVDAALARLSRDPDGFIALLETEGTDNAGHANVPVEEVVAEVREFDRAVARALDFARRDGHTLLIVTADHETGGLAVLEEDGRAVAKYITGDHTGALVPLFAFGPGAERFGGIHANSEIGRMLREVVAGRR